MRPLIFDLETTTVRHLGRVASPFCKDNWIVAPGWAYGKEKPFGEYYTEPSTIDIPCLDDVDVLVAHNAKFDLLYLWDYPQIRDFIARGGRIWCTQLAEYLINGQTPDWHMNSLNDCAVKYGGNTKIDAVKEMWEQGINTPDIPQQLLMDYLLGTADMEGDIGNTQRVYYGQLQVLEENFPPETLTMIQNRMESLLATTEMEYNGLFVNREVGEEIRIQLAEDVQALDAELNAYLPEMPPECVFNWQSIYDKSYLIYGGTKKYSKWVAHTDVTEAGGGLRGPDGRIYSKSVEKWPLFGNEPIAPERTELRDGLRWFNDKCQDVYKSGKQVGNGKFRNVDVPDLSKPKGKQRDHYFVFEGFTQPSAKWASTLTDGAGKCIYSTSADIIEELGKRGVPFLSAMAKRQKYVKDLGTYYWTEDNRGNRKGLLTAVGEDGIVHHSLNHTSTVTGRMSSSNPNLQNLPRKGTSQVKRMFESRFGDDGYIVEMDYSALEVYVQAVLTHEKNMMRQIDEGIDFHCFRLSMKLGEDYDEVVKKCKDETHPDHVRYDQMRTQIKGFSFQLAYGAGAPAIAESIGMTVDEVKELMENEAIAYPAIAKFDDMLADAIKSNYVLTSRRIPIRGLDVNVGRGHWIAPTGTVYCWTEHEAPDFLQDRGQMTSFSPTERKNYPVQGFGGEIMQTMLGLLFRWFVANNNFGGKALLINTVHDSCYLDIHKDVVHDVVPTSCKILAAVRQKFNSDYDIGIPIDFAVDAEIGKSQYAEKGYDPTKQY